MLKLLRVLFFIINLFTYFKLYQQKQIRNNIWDELKLDYVHLKTILKNPDELKIYLNENNYLSISSSAYDNINSFESKDIVNKKISTNTYTSISNNFFSIINDSQLRGLFSKLCTVYVQNTKLGQEDCYSSLLKLDISNLNMVEFPYNFTSAYFDNLNHLNVSNNAISSLREIKISSNNLETLDLSNNKLNSIGLNTFKNLKNLKYLYLNSNQIHDINLFSFELNVNLIELNLRQNLINDNVIQFTIFSNFKKLKHLDLSFNALKRFNYYLVQNLISLENLLLSNNKLKHVDSILFRYFKLIDLSYNYELKLTSGGSSGNASNGNNLRYELTLNSTNRLQHLSLAGLDMSNTSDLNEWINLLKFNNVTSTIKELNLSDCRLNTMTNEFIDNFKNIEKIDLSHNYLTRLDCTLGKRLKFINMNFNSISDLKRIFNCIQESDIVDVRNNQISSLDSFDPVLDSNNNYSQILLEGNPLVCDCEFNSWWTNTSQHHLFTFSKNMLVKVLDFENLSCSFLASSYAADTHERDAMISIKKKSFEKFDNTSLLTSIICIYKKSCSPLNCECCEFRACDCKYECPANCECYRSYLHTTNSVSCRMKNLTQTPFSVSISVTELDLSDNNLRKLNSYEFFAKNKLISLNLSFNQINYIEENSFHSLSKLKYLLLRQNQLKIFYGFEFNDLPSLEYLDLSSNLIQFIALNTFRKLANLKYLNLNFNSLKHIIEDKQYFKFNFKLDFYLNDDKVIHIEHQNTTLLSTAEISTKSSIVTSSMTLTDIYEIGMSAKMNLLRNNGDLVVFECINRIYERFLNANLSQFNELIVSKRENASNILYDQFLKILLNIKQKCEYKNVASIKLHSENDAVQADYLKQEDNYLVLNKISFIFYIVLTVVFTIMMSLLIVVIVLNLKKYNLSSSILRIFRFLKEKYFLNKNLRNNQLNVLPRNFSSVSYMHSLNSTNSCYYYFYRNLELNNNEKNNMNLKNNFKLNKTKKLNYDFFMIYNKLDADLVHNLIAPILKSKPYYYAIALQHIIKLLNTSDNSISDVSNYQDYIKSSSYVVFIISKHLLTDFEYKLVCKTPKYKRVVILIDSINESVVRKLIKPKKVIKWQFLGLNDNKNNDCIMKSLNYEKLFPFVDNADEI